MSTLAKPTPFQRRLHRPNRGLFLPGKVAAAPTSPPIAGYNGWWDAANTATITIDTGASQWDDQSGNGYHFTSATSSQQPASGTRTINSKNVLDFDGSDDRMISTLPSDDITSTVFMVALCDNISGYRSLLVPSGNSRRQIYIEQTTGKLIVDKQGDVNLIATSNGVTAGVAFSAAIQLTGSAARVTMVATVSTSSYSQSFSGGGDSRLGVNSASSDVFNGTIGEIITYASTLSDADVTSTLSYLNTKWGTT